MVSLILLRDRHCICLWMLRLMGRRLGHMLSKLWNRCMSSVISTIDFPFLLHVITSPFWQPLIKKHLTDNNQTQSRLSLHRHKRHLHLRRRNRNRHRQHTSKPRPTCVIPRLFLGRPNPNPQQHLLQHHLPRLTYRINSFLSNLRHRARNESKRDAAGFVESPGSDRSWKGD